MYNSPIVEMENASFTYANGAADGVLKNINLNIEQGQVVLLCGESGCGKTTLARLLNGLIPHFYKGELQGQVKLGGNNISVQPLYETAKQVGSVFQNPRTQFFNVDTTGEIAFGCENQNLPAAVIWERIARVVKDFSLQRLMNRSIFELSGGEKQKIACASVSACEPQLFVLDEPTANLDTCSTTELGNVLREWKRQGKTVVVAEHRLYFLKDIADRVIFMRKGEIAADYTAAEFWALPPEEISGMGLRPLAVESYCRSQSALPLQARQSFTLHGFCHSYKRGQAQALHIDNLCLPSGAAVAVIGHNGAGKSTFAKCLCGLEKKCPGVLQCQGKSSHGRKRVKNCYMVMQDVNHQLFTESVLEEVLLSMQKPEEPIAEQILAKLDLLPLKGQHPMALSGGQKQRVAIASAVASARDYILFDEPTSGLDLRHMQEVAASLRSLCEAGKTVFVVTHDPELVFSACNYVVELCKGEVAAQYPLDKNGGERVLQFFGYNA